MNYTINDIINRIADLPKKKMDNKEQDFVRRYLGTQKKVLGASTGNIVKIAKEVVKDKNIKVGEIIELLNTLFAGGTFEEHAVGGKIFTFIKPKIRSLIPFSVIEKWLAKARGWIEIDVICQSAFTGAEVQDRRADWEKTISKFASSDNISLRRASLVLQTKPAREIDDKKMRRLGFETIGKLKSEKEILITKAVSWLLRALTVCDKEEVSDYILKNESSLPRIAVRETLKKIDTGKKNGVKIY